MKLLNIKFHEIPLGGSLLVTCTQTDGQTDMMKLIHMLGKLSIVKTPKRINTDISAYSKDQCHAAIQAIRSWD